MLSSTMRDILIEHIDGPVTLGQPPKDSVLGVQRDHSLRRQNLMTALRSGLLEKVSATETAMTDRGREELCKMLAHMAEVLVRAGFEFKSAPPVIVDKLRDALEKSSG